jgi:hypothetical protein
MPSPQAMLGLYSHLLLRLYTSTHLLAAYIFFVGGLDGWSRWLQPDNWSPELRVLGLWYPSVVGGIMPLLGLLLLVR